MRPPVFTVFTDLLQYRNCSFWNAALHLWGNQDSCFIDAKGPASDSIMRQKHFPQLQDSSTISRSQLCWNCSAVTLGLPGLPGLGRDPPPLTKPKSGFRWLPPHLSTHSPVPIFALQVPAIESSDSTQFLWDARTSCRYSRTERTALPGHDALASLGPSVQGPH